MGDPRTDSISIIYIYMCGCMCERIEPLPLATDGNSQLPQETCSVPNTRNQMVKCYWRNPVPQQVQPQHSPMFSRKQLATAPVRHPTPTSTTSLRRCSRREHVRKWLHDIIKVPRQKCHIKVDKKWIIHTPLLFFWWDTGKLFRGIVALLFVPTNCLFPMKSRSHRTIENIQRIAPVEAE